MLLLQPWRREAEARETKKAQEKEEAERVKVEVTQEDITRSEASTESRRLANSQESIDDDAAFGKLTRKGKRKV